MFSKNLNKSTISLVFDCPVCNANNSTFDVKGWGELFEKSNNSILQIFSTCRACKYSLCLNGYVKKELERTLKLDTKSNSEATNKLRTYLFNFLNEHERDASALFSSYIYVPVLPRTDPAPEFLPENIEIIYNEATQCLALNCFNAAGAMFRLCLDQVTKHILKMHSSKAPTAADNKSIHNRLKWIFENGVLPAHLEELSRNIKDDGNDAAHDGSIKKEEAEDLLDFTYILLEQVYTIPKRVEIAAQRRIERRQSN